MADISKITLPSGSEYNIKDAKARKGPYYGVCSTGASTVAKTVTIDGISELETGLTIAVKFSNANSASSPTLNVNSLGAKSIYQYGTTKAAGTAATTGWQAGHVVLLVYDGTGWQYIKGYNTNTTYSGMTAAEIDAGTGTTNRLISPSNLKSAIIKWTPTDSSLDMYHRTNCNLVLIGDSWTVGGSASSTSKRYATLLCNKLGMTEFNYGVNAAGFTRDGNLFITQVNTANSEMTAAEKEATGIVTIIGGVNDFRHKDDEGAVISIDTFTDAVIACTNRAHEVFPNALIVVGLSNSNLAWYTETMQHWMSYARRELARTVTYPVLIIKNLAASVNGVTANYISDKLHLSDRGHSLFAAHIANAILGGGQDVYYYLGMPVATSYISSWEFEPHFFRSNDTIRLTSGYMGMASGFKGDKIIATFPDMAFVPKDTIYTPAYFRDRQIGLIAFTASGNIWFLEQPYITSEETLHLSVSSFSSFPKTISNSKITTTMNVTNCAFGNPSAIIGDMTWSTNTAGSLVLDGTISGSTTAEIDLVDSNVYSANTTKEALRFLEVSWTFTGADGMT